MSDPDGEAALAQVRVLQLELRVAHALAATLLAERFAQAAEPEIDIARFAETVADTWAIMDTNMGNRRPSAQQEEARARIAGDIRRWIKAAVLAHQMQSRRPESRN